MVSVEDHRPVRLAILGSTGSVGTQALEVVRANPGAYEVVALAAGRNQKLLTGQAAEFGVPELRARCAAEDPGVLAGLASLPEVDIVLNAVVGFAGLPATVAALEAGKRLALANKESLIAAGPLVAAARSKGSGEIVPVDSEHSAVYQALQAGPPGAVRRILLTASGGPFRGRSKAELERVTVADALAHPTWSMGPKITVDSSTLMNKGLEVIEAWELFGVELERIEVVVHPQSVIHGMVEFSDGSTIAQLSMPDMRLPIAYALAAPGRVPQPVGVIDWARLGTLTFESPDVEAFPCLGLAYRAATAGGDAPATLNAANEVAVAAFLGGRLPWRGIADVVGEVLGDHEVGKVSTIEDVVESDGLARRRAAAAVDRRNAA
ncbi:MAG: 1-deoxy-D-xylulose-5-phosphate reductoisomerase [Actinomycetota bacterium]|nr:1-deoxy-D-xylulose-5-phosphate reductoisomerase [Actinomycetota bacterium]MDQ1498885.1 1-deoxy-D-xylulose-5-phosphate reductoisomerase [Actinomycetota bacterium]